MGPKLRGFEVSKIFHRIPSEIEAPGTPRWSLGTKFFGPKIYLHEVSYNLFYSIFRFIGQNLKFQAKNRSFSSISALTERNAKISMF